MDQDVPTRAGCAANWSSERQVRTGTAGSAVVGKTLPTKGGEGLQGNPPLAENVRDVVRVRVGVGKGEIREKRKERADSRDMAKKGRGALQVSACTPTSQQPSHMVKQVPLQQVTPASPGQVPAARTSNTWNIRL
ncbi:hypothetical protein Bbelb_195830 [Branchiostoma belcheri]|nr:hypothetical protein Bbelb_195830 [Branchiostoma belcheri]